MENKDIYRAAKLYIDQYGNDAVLHASMKADAMLDAGDLDGCAVWKGIVRAIEAIQGTEGGTRN